MLRFYWERFLELPWLLIESFTTIEGWIAVIAFIAMFFSPEIGRRWAGWKTFNRKWAIAVVAIHLVFLTLQSNYRAFTTLVTDKDALIQAADQKATDADQELARVETLMKQLTIENAALQKGAPVLTDGQARVAAAREQLLSHADRAPLNEDFSHEKAIAWQKALRGMLDHTIDSNETQLYVRELSEDELTLEGLSLLVGQLRGVAMNLMEHDLHDNGLNR